jgi:hypothetical protein
MVQKYTALIVSTTAELILKLVYRILIVNTMVGLVFSISLASQVKSVFDKHQEKEWFRVHIRKISFNNIL